ncbi:MAG: hypothetical protein ABF449_02600 [Ethanoligenens sp.]
MKKLRRLATLCVLSIFAFCFSLNVLAGTYTSTSVFNGSFTTPNVTVTNTFGQAITGQPYRFTTAATNVTGITGYFQLNSTTDNTALNGMQIYYSSDGTNFTYGTSISCPTGQQVSFTLNFSSAPKTVTALFFIPNQQYWPGYNYTVWAPSVTQILTDNTPPTITLYEQSGFSSSSEYITAYFSDSQSGVTLQKWASGSQSVSYFASNGTSFSSSGFYVYSNGTYTVYAKDAAGNEAVATISATKIDASPPSISASASTTYAPTNTITVTTSDSQSGVSLTKWALGSQSVSYFSSGGTTFTGSSITVSSNGTYTVFAKDSVGNVAITTVNVAYVDNTVTVTHPLTVGYSINPNNSMPFSCPDITITNNSRIKVQVSVQQFKATAGGSIAMTDVSPTKHSDWSKLNAAQTKSEIALGLIVKETATGTSTWYSILNSSVLYAANISAKTALGVLNPNGAVGHLAITGDCGLAWDNAYTSTHSLTLVFDAY